MLPDPKKFTRVNLVADLADVETGRNPSYLDSLRLGLERGVFRAPGSLLDLIGWPVAAILMSLLYIVVGLFIWGIVRLHFVGFGLVGFLRPRRVRNSKSALS